MHTLAEALNQSEERDQARREKFLQEVYAAQKNESGWLTTAGNRQRMLVQPAHTLITILINLVTK